MGKKTYFLVILMVLFPLSGQGEVNTESKKGKSVSIFPILMYDSDIGVGYGGKAKLVNFMKKNESFDLILFNSSNGERWYVFAFSFPDIEIRQGTKYALAIDVKAEYDKYLKYYYYGQGPDSREESLTEFTQEKKQLELKLARGFNPNLIFEISYFLKNIKYYNISEDKPFSKTLGEVGEQFSPFISFFFRYDTSDSQIHPKHGVRLCLQNDLAAGFVGNKNARFFRYTLDFRNYFLLFGSRDVVAIRGLAQNVTGSNVPLFEMCTLGGGGTLEALRGFKLNRFNDKGKFLINTEYRFPIWKKLGGNIFIDTGMVWPSWKNIKIRDLKINAGLGLRYYLANFVVRFDMGFSREGMGIYFNFGHLF